MLWDPESQPMRRSPFAAPCDHTSIGHASAAPLITMRSFRLAMWTVIEPFLKLELGPNEHNITTLRMRPCVKRALRGLGCYLQRGSDRSGW